MLAIVTGCGTVGSRDDGHDQEAWRVEKLATEQGTECRMHSAPVRFTAAHGVDWVTVTVDHAGVIRLRARQDAFDRRAISQIGVRVNDSQPVLNPEPGTSAQELVFNKRESARLLDQLARGSTARVQVALAPSQELLSQPLDLRTFQEEYLKYKVCKVFADGDQAAARPYPRLR